MPVSVWKRRCKVRSLAPTACAQASHGCLFEGSAQNSTATSTRASVGGHGQVEGRDVCGSDLVNNHGSKTPLRAVRTISVRKVHCSNDSRSQEWADLHHRAPLGVDRRDVRTELQGPQLDGAGDSDAVPSASGYPNRSCGGYNPYPLGRFHCNDTRGRVDQLTDAVMMRADETIGFPVRGLTRNK